MAIVGVTTNANESESIGELSDSPRAARPGDRTGVRPGVEGLLTVREIAAYLCLPVSSIYKMTAARAVVRIPHIRIGGTLRFRKRDIDQWLVLLTDANVDALAKARQKGIEAANGHHSQAPPEKR